MSEVCKNPFKHNPVCTNTDIKLYIVFGKGKKQETLPICNKCWNSISDSKKEWGDSPRVYPTFGISEEEMKTLQIIDTMNIGKMKKTLEESPSEDDIEEY